MGYATLLGSALWALLANKLRSVAIASEPHSSGGGTSDSTVQPRDDRAIVWKLVSDNTIVPVEVALGITDHAYTEVTAVVPGELRPGDDVVTTAVASKATAPGAQGLRR
jgi:hypothetical protein